MTNSADLHPDRIPGYDGGPLTHQTGVLDEPLFWLGHLYSCAHSEGAEELLFGADYDDAGEFQRRLWEQANWPTFTIPLADDHRLHVVYRTFTDESGTDYLIHHPDWEKAELLAQDDGHFMGPALSWPELVAVADNALPGGSTTDPHARLLLLLPTLGDDELPGDAVERLAAALRACTRVEDPGALGAVLLNAQGATGPAHWTTDSRGSSVNDGAYSFRNPANHFALPVDRMAQVASALAP
ncbi:hypothetical protein [Streptomyces antarcticus]|uniref:hypothetical protein n=1 Tax=Streptomyces antarcticus TaxID=2996458 RepID=UPI002270E1F8|nr:MULTISPECIES: hypothetical protein [unclassified Streptomyces]MCY0943698.1 hypothetical protein [Streptomyces sp. H34-AA3]MCZ4084261.1 hypothetical protein [Streptomyces sp. H34-S5]